MAHGPGVKVLYDGHGRSNVTDVDLRQSITD